ncbi:sterol desaturase family protein [Cocleimonas sp. KMM 6892]|uniref:sterol desaturase family protein n=1 Tax=unclassified Cocleimonas TaxID=2639732 RepID=UPI002DBE55F9|nr:MULTISPECIES: sterol desaturase family protein [unclassified Cocleimonas]MEB8434420.1 sterol desaturase family protein [Cocleimonas sp. KMM 6892]MEC4717313.1 sterol desaturase family protein [Cocleimonas sp. KMM 6895]MEC4746692.1 sterol desaturase family protein [Cocleimonas sp. KMM 6896]
MINFIKNNYFEIQFAALFGGIFLVYILEGYFPRRRSDTNQTNRWVSNISLAIFNHFLILFYTFNLALILNQFQPDSPLLRHFGFSDIASLFVLLFAFEFTSYWSHRAFHKFPILWRIHSVHHSDTEIDVTTGVRHHPFEPLIINTIIITPMVMLLGAPVISIILFNFVRTIIVLTSHSNLIIPKRLDKVLRLFVTTPDYHRMHHSSDRRYTDSNFCIVFPIFDYVFGTATKKPYEEIPNMQIGLEQLRSNEDQRIDQLIMRPFTYNRNPIKRSL